MDRNFCRGSSSSEGKGTGLRCACGATLCVVTELKAAGTIRRPFRMQENISLFLSVRTFFFTFCVWFASFCLSFLLIFLFLFLI